MNIKAHLKTWVISLSRVAFLKTFFSFLYFIQLQIIVFILKRQPILRAIILRRRAVLKDLYPGDSDFDLTCVLGNRAQVAVQDIKQLLKVYNRLKSICPVLGETQFVHEEDFEKQLTYCPANYDKVENFCFLYKDPAWRFNPPVLKTREFALQRLFASLFVDLPKGFIQILSKPYRSESFFLRPLIKTAGKIDRFFKLFQEAEADDLKHRKYRNSKWFGTLDNALQIMDYCHRDLGALKMPDTTNIKFIVKGSDAILPSYQLNKWSTLFQVHLSPLRALIEEVILFNFRPRLISNLFVIRLKSEIPWYRDAVFLKTWQALGKEIRKDPLPFWTHLPLIITPKGWEFAKNSDPVMHFLYQNHRYDLLNNIPIGNLNEYQLPVSTIQIELCETICNIYSALRARDTLFLLDLIFGNLILYRIILEKQIFYSSFEEFYRDVLLQMDWNAAQKEILVLYRQSDLKQLHRLNALSVWEIFGDWISREVRKTDSAFSSHTGQLLPRNKTDVAAGKLLQCFG